MTESEPNESPQLTPQQELRNSRFIEAAARVQQDSSSESVHAYLNALANVTFLCPLRKSEAGVEFYITHFGGDPVPLLPVFTSIEEYESFGSIIPPGYEPESIAAVTICRITIDLFADNATLAINPAKPNFFRVPPNLIRILANAEQQAPDVT